MPTVSLEGVLSRIDDVSIGSLVLILKSTCYNRTTECPVPLVQVYSVIPSPPFDVCRSL